MREEKTSLEKSHSAWSNTKLTFLCIETILVHSGLWASIALYVYGKLTGVVGIGVIAAFAVLTILNMLLFNNFKR